MYRAAALATCIRTWGSAPDAAALDPARHAATAGYTAISPSSTSRSQSSFHLCGRNARQRIAPGFGLLLHGLSPLDRPLQCNFIRLSGKDALSGPQCWSSRSQVPCHRCPVGCSSSLLHVLPPLSHHWEEAISIPAPAAISHDRFFQCSHSPSQWILSRIFALIVAAGISPADSSTAVQRSPSPSLASPQAHRCFRSVDGNWTYASLLLTANRHPD